LLSLALLFQFIFKKLAELLFPNVGLFVLLAGQAIPVMRIHSKIKIHWQQINSHLCFSLR